MHFHLFTQIGRGAKEMPITKVTECEYAYNLDRCIKSEFRFSCVSFVCTVNDIKQQPTDKQTNRRNDKLARMNSVNCGINGAS